MDLLGVLLFIHVVDVSAQLISDQQTKPGFIQIQSRNQSHHSVPSTKTSSEIRESETRGRNRTGCNYDNQRDNSKNQRDANIKGNRRTDPTPKVFTNVGRDQNGNNVKYIQRLKPSSEPDKIIFYDDVNYDREPFTNKRKPEDSFIYSTGPSRVLSITPSRETSISSDKQHLNGSKSTSIDRHNISYNIATKETLYNNKDEETTTVEVELDNRVAFTGDSCATGLVKVKGKCVKEVT